MPLRRVGCGRNEENHGGHDCNFVEPPPEAFQTDCPICLLILKEPCLISCCGHKFCRECIERMTKDAKPCPLCKEPNFTYMRDLGLERSLKELEVWCSHKKDGCEWRGKLGKLEEHVNREMSPRSQLIMNGCGFVAVECTHKCGERFQRRHIATHQNEQCMERLYACEYCRYYTSTFKGVTEIHYAQCGKYPVVCPIGCDVHKMEQLERHLRDKCPLTLVNCPFHYAGCETQLPRKDMPEHMKEPVTHLTLLATVTQELSIENQKLAQENQQLKGRILQRKDESRKSIEAIQASHKKIKVKNEELKLSTAALLQNLNLKYDSVEALQKQKQVMELQQRIKKLELEKEQEYRELL